MIIIAGCGVSGQGAAKFAAEKKLEYVIADQGNEEKFSSFVAALPFKPAKTIFSWTEATPLPDAETVVLSPGIRETSDFYKALAKTGGEMASELEFASRFIKKPMISVTGTNGKTTVTELVNAIFNAAGLKTDAAGNIGNALTTFCDRDELDCIAVEVSSFQMEHASTFTPQAAAILNLASDHIDRHGTMEEYARLKFITAQRSVLPPVINANLAEYSKKYLFGKPYTTFSAKDASADWSFDGKFIVYHGKKIFDTRTLRLKGIHNVENVMAALALLETVKSGASSDAGVTDTLKNFVPDAHRFELFAENGGVTFINDSKATNPHAVNAALASCKGDYKTILLLGGLDKGMDFTELLPYMGKVKYAVIYGRCAEKIEGVLKNHAKCIMAKSFDDAVNSAFSGAEKGEIVMLSPACASMDMFKDYKERGNVFKQKILELIAEQDDVPDRCVLEIDLGIIRENYKKICKLIPGFHVHPVIKSDAYGLGAIEVGKTLYEAGATEGFFVASISEAAKLAKEGLKSTVLGGITEDEMPFAVRHGIKVCVSTLEMAKKLNAAAEKIGRKASCFAAIDTGMGRLGILWEKAPKELAEIKRLPYLDCYGLYSHAPRPEDEEYVTLQRDRFVAVLDHLKDEYGIEFEERHLACGNAIGSNMPSIEPPFNTVRPGIVMYGMTGSNQSVDVKCPIRMRAKIFEVRLLKEGSLIGYSSTCCLKEDTFVASVSAGYADGIPLALSNRGHFLLDGKICPVLGRVAMDCTTISLNAFGDKAFDMTGRDVICIGESGKEAVTLEDWAEMKGTHPHDILCAIGPRTKRIYKS